MSTPMRTAIEDSVIARLGALKSSGKVKEIAAYNAELDGMDEADSAKMRLQGRSPAILVSTSSGSYRVVSTTKRKAHVDVTVDLLVIARDQSTREDRTRGELGVYAMLEAAAHLLLGHRVADDGTNYTFGAMSPQSESVIRHSPDLCMWRQSYTLTAEIARTEDASLDLVTVDSMLNAPTADDNAGDPLLTARNT